MVTPHPGAVDSISKDVERAKEMERQTYGAGRYFQIKYLVRACIWQIFISLLFVCFCLETESCSVALTSLELGSFLLVHPTKRWKGMHHQTRQSKTLQVICLLCADTGVQIRGQRFGSSIPPSSLLWTQGLCFQVALCLHLPSHRRNPGNTNACHQI